MTLSAIIINLYISKQSLFSLRSVWKSMMMQNVFNVSGNNISWTVEKQHHTTENQYHAKRHGVFRLKRKMPSVIRAVDSSNDLTVVSCRLNILSALMLRATPKIKGNHLPPDWIMSMKNVKWFMHPDMESHLHPLFSLETVITPATLKLTARINHLFLITWCIAFLELNGSY